MPKRVRLVIIVVLVLVTYSVITTIAEASSHRAGVRFLAIEPGARALGMGGAFCGLADDGLASYYNPAGLAFQHSLDALTNQSWWLPGLYPNMHYGYSSIVIPLGRNITLAIALTGFTTGKSLATDPSGNEIAEWHPLDTAVGISCGIPVSDILGVGVGFKFIGSHLVPSWIIEQLLWREGGSGIGIGMDVGALLRLPLTPYYGQIGFGTTLQNLGPSIRYTDAGGSDPLPAILRMGLSYTLTGNEVLALTGKSRQDILTSIGVLRDNSSTLPNWLIDCLFNQSRISIAGDFRLPIGGSSSLGDVIRYTWWSLGAEFAPLGIFPIRWGYLCDKSGSRQGMTWSVGVDFRFLRFDVGTDALTYHFSTNNWTCSLALNIRRPNTINKILFGAGCILWHVLVSSLY